MLRLRPLTRREVIVDAVIAGVTLVLFLVWAVILGTGGVLLLVIFSGALFLRRLNPGLALAVAWLAAIVQMSATLDPNPMNLIVLGVLFATSAYGTARERWAGFASSFIAALAIAVYVVVIPALVEYGVYGDSTLMLGSAFTAAFLFGAALAGFLLSWTAGLLTRTWRTARVSTVAAAEAELEVVAEQERTRIARDMHDVVAHSLAVVIAQADGARYLRKTDPEAVDGALETIAATSREALADVRVLLAQLRHSQGDAPQPVMADLGRLYEQLRAAGLDLREEISGTPLALGTSSQLAVYRIVQESLTNVLRHGDTSEPVTLRFDWAPGGLHLSVSSAVRGGRTGPAVASGLAAGATGGIPFPAPGRGPITGSVIGGRAHGGVSDHSQGHGIAGMTERASIIGGSLTALVDGPRFIVRAWLPADERAALERNTTP